MFRGGSRSRHPTVSCISGVKRDSTLDAGNNNRINTPVKCNFPPYGRDFPGGVPTGRFSNGKLTSDFVGVPLYRFNLSTNNSDLSCRAWQQPMGDEKKDGGAGDPIKMLLEEALARQRKEMMDNFTQILWRLPKGEASSSDGHAIPFKVHVNYDIPLFEGLIDADVVDKWLNLLEGYFLVHNFFDREKITFALLNVVSLVTKGGGRAKFVWGKEQQRAFNDLKHRLFHESTIFMFIPVDLQLFRCYYVNLELLRHIWLWFFSAPLYFSNNELTPSIWRCSLVSI